MLGEKAYASLTEAAQHERIDLVNIFRNSEDVPPIVDEALFSERIERGRNRVIFHLKSASAQFAWCKSTEASNRLNRM